MILDDILISCNHFWVTVPIGYLHVSQAQTIQYKHSDQTIIIKKISNLFSKIISKNYARVESLLNWNVRKPHPQPQKCIVSCSDEHEGQS